MPTDVTPNGGDRLSLGDYFSQGRRGDRRRGNLGRHLIGCIVRLDDSVRKEVRKLSPRGFTEKIAVKEFRPISLISCRQLIKNRGPLALKLLLRRGGLAPDISSTLSFRDVKIGSTDSFRFFDALQGGVMADITVVQRENNGLRVTPSNFRHTLNMHSAKGTFILGVQWHSDKVVKSGHTVIAFPLAAGQQSVTQKHAVSSINLEFRRLVTYRARLKTDLSPERNQGTVKVSTESVFPSRSAFPKERRTLREKQ